MTFRSEILYLACATAIAIVAIALPVASQPAGRLATTVSMLRTYPLFFHGRLIVIRSPIVQTDTLTRLATPLVPAEAEPPRMTPIFVFWKERPARTDGEIRGKFWDLGRLREDDSRLANFDFRPLLDAVSGGRWPGREEVFVLLGATVVEAAESKTASVRALALSPESFVDHQLTVVGRFRGRNLYGDLPAALNKSRWDFVIQSADAAVWVSGLRPRGKGFELDPAARVDTGRWVEVSGTLKREGSRVWIEATGIELATEPSDEPVDVDIAPIVKEAAPEVIFTAPIADDTDVERTTSVRIQFSRDMDPRTFRNRVRVTYASPAQGTAPTPPVPTANYNEGNRALEIKLSAPFERFQQVTIELLEGVAATDGQQLKPWRLTFTTGG